jgi:hypothetical protein
MKLEVKNWSSAEVLEVNNSLDKASEQINTKKESS